MAKFLNTEKAVSELVDLIETANQTLILISPYLKLSKKFQELLKYRNSKDKKTTVIFREHKLQDDELEFFRELRFSINLKYCEDLHAKCYVNDNKMIITSLNFYNTSMKDNKEMGILLDKNDLTDFKVFEDAMKGVDYIQRISQPFEFSHSKLETSEKKASIFKSKNNKNGYCIRTGVEIPFNVDEPLCDEAFKRWAVFGDPDYGETYCHFSGELSDGETSVAKPILKKYWKKAKEIHDL